MLLPLQQNLPGAQVRLSWLEIEPAVATSRVRVSWLEVEEGPATPGGESHPQARMIVTIGSIMIR